MTTTPPRARPARGGKAESVVQVLILLTIGGCAAAASFTHVRNVAQSHGQPGWLAWADAVVLELMSIATGLEIRRRHRTAQPAGFVLAVLAAAVLLSLSAQVVEAERSVIGWLAAALPALGFLACVKIVLTRQDAVPTGPHPEDRPEIEETVPADSVPVPVVRPAPLPLGLLDRARAADTAHTAATGRTITRDRLRDELRISNALAGDVLRTLRAETSPTVNGHALSRMSG